MSVEAGRTLMRTRSEHEERLESVKQEILTAKNQEIQTLKVT
jgi:hypothetical protein